MEFEVFKEKYQKVPVVEYPNQRKTKIAVVTIKVITYNHGKFITQCLESLVQQKTNFDYEILIAEDDSSDETRDICISYAKKYPTKIRLFLNSRQNNIKYKGKSTGVFNNAYANYNLKSKYTCLLEGDDYWTDDYSLQKRVDFLEKNEDFVMCFHNISTIENGVLRNLDGVLRYKQRTSVLSENMINTYMPTSTIMQRNFLLIPFEDGITKIICGDMVSRGKLSFYGKAMYLPEIENAVYRKHAGGIFSAQTIDFRTEHALKANKYIAEFFEKEKYNVNYANESWVEGYLIHCMNTFKETKKINYSLLKRGAKKAKELEVSFFKVIKTYITSRLKMIFSN